MTEQRSENTLNVSCAYSTISVLLVVMNAFKNRTDLREAKEHIKPKINLLYQLFCRSNGRQVNATLQTKALTEILRIVSDFVPTIGL